MQLFTFIFNYADTYAPAICLLVMFYKFRKIPGYLKPVSWYLLFCFIAYGVTNLYADLSIPNLFFYHFITIIEFALIAFYISKSIHSGFKKKIILLSGILLFTFFLFNLCLWEKLTQFPSYLISLSCFLLIGCSFLYYADMIETSEIFVFRRQPAFWIITGIFVYSAVCFFVFFFYRYVKIASITTEFKKMTWKIQEVMIFVKYAFFIIGVVCKK
jgi:hypothetical protein